MAEQSYVFRLRCQTEAGEVLAVTGSSQHLGAWRKSAVLPMVQDSEDRSLWQLAVDLSTTELHQYRYCVVVILQPLFPGNPRRIIVRRWETHFIPRTADLRQDSQERTDSFGDIGGLTRVQRGWLTDEQMIQFKLCPGALRLYKKKHSGHRLWVKVTPLVKEWQHQDSQEVSEDSVDIQDVRSRSGVWPIVEAAAMSEKYCQRRIQEQFGIEFLDEENSFVIFEAQLLNSSSVAFLIDIYSLAPGESELDFQPTHAGMCYVYPDNLKLTIGTLNYPITSMKFQPIGKITIEYLVTQSTPGLEMDFSSSYRNYWSGIEGNHDDDEDVDNSNNPKQLSDDWKGLDVGHRGLGNSYTKGLHCSSIKENTLASMKDAIQHGADMVEFDVQVSKDLVPVVYHEFRLCVQTRTKQGGDIMLDIPVKDLTLPELQALKVHHPSEKESGLKSFGNEGDEEHQPFPTLESILCKLDQHCGFNIEIKYSQLLKDQQEEDKNPMEMNLFLDQVLRTVLRHGGDRKIIFSSFNPDICTMIINKQNKYPVLLLTQGENSGYEEYCDPRTWSIRNGVLFVEMSGLLGLSVRAEALLRNPHHLEKVREHNQVIFVWTDEQNDKETVQHLKKLGVNGVIYDRMDQNNDKLVKESIFLTDKYCPRKDSNLSSGVSSDDDGYSTPSSSPSRQSLNFSGVIQK